MTSAGRSGVLAALFLSALALRPQLVGIGPILPEIQADLGVSHAVAGLLATIPVLCMGLFAPVAAPLSSRVGTRVAIALCLALIGAFGLARAGAPGAALVVLLTFPVGVGMGLAGALLPIAVKEEFAHRPASATGVYATGMNVGSTLAAALAVPIAAAFGGWRASLAVFSAFTLVLFVTWLALTNHWPRHVRSTVRRVRLPWRSGMAWVFVGMFALLGTMYYGLTAWLPDSLVERGWSDAEAGWVLAVYNLAALPASLGAAWLADHVGSRRAYLVGAAVAITVASVGFVLWPGAGFLWAVVAGMANGVLFPLLLTLPLDVSARPEQVGAVAGMMLGAGYCISSTSPFVLGAIRDATGSFTATLWVVVAAGVALLCLALPLTRERLSRGVGIPAPVQPTP
jgi:MFS transporter, CP family, cyanate transporter